MRKGYFAAKDIAIGIDGNVMICTGSGHVYIGTKRKEAKVKKAFNQTNQTVEYEEIIFFKYLKVPFLQHVVKIAASSSGAYCVIRQDIKPVLESVPIPSKLPFASLYDSVSDTITCQGPTVHIHLDQGSILADQDVLIESLFFKAFLTTHSWKLKKIDNIIHVKMKHFPLKPFKIVIRWMYMKESADDLFQFIESDSIVEFISFIIQVQFIANELLLNDLIDECTVLLARLLDISNVLELLSIAHDYHFERLEKAALEFINSNIEIMLESRNLSDLPLHIVEKIENSLKLCQDSKSPFTRGAGGYYSIIKKLAKQAEEDKKKQRRYFVFLTTVKHGNYPILSKKVIILEKRLIPTSLMMTCS